MEKKSKKSIIIGITSLLLVTLILLGLTYAYYRTRIIGNTNDKSISVTSKLLEVTYSDDNSTITATGIEPGYAATKTFSVTNTGDATVNYSIVLDNVVNEFVRAEDWTYTLKKGNTIVLENKQVPLSKTWIVNSVSIDSGVTDEYTLTINYANLTNIDQSEDMGASLSFRINIDDALTSLSTAAEGTLLAAIANDNVVSETLTIPGQATSGIKEAVLASTEDDYGTSYYYRGTVENNYVTFSGMCWRIVRVQGDGTVKLVLADRDNGCTTEEGYDAIDGQSAFIADPSTQGFLYKYDQESTENDLVYGTSYIPEILNAWINGGTYKYHDVTNTEEDVFEAEGTFTQKISAENQEKLATTEWCNDTSVTGKIFFDEDGNEISETDENFDELLYSTELSYGAYDRLADRSTAEPSLKCNFTGLDNTKSTKHESNIGILSADEVAFAGGVYLVGNNSYYLYTNTNSNDNVHPNGNMYWTLSPFLYGSEEDIQGAMLAVDSLGSLNDDANIIYYLAISIRPSVVLRSDVTIVSGGNGTQTNPYVIN